MPLPLHKSPVGLLDLLKLRTLGRNPEWLNEVVGPILDATNFYGADLQVVASDSGGAGAMSRSVSGTAARPGRLLAMSGQVTVGAAAGTQIRLLVSYTPGPSFSAVILATEVITAPVAGAVYAVAAVLPSPIVFAPGAGFTFTVAGDAAGADHTPVRRDLFENYAQ